MTKEKLTNETAQAFNEMLRRVQSLINGLEFTRDSMLDAIAEDDLQRYVNRLSEVSSIIHNFTPVDVRTAELVLLATKVLK